MKLTMHTSSKSYDIILGKHILNSFQDYVDIHKKIFILCDTNIPDEYITQISKQCSHFTIYKVTPGETSKSIATYEAVLQACLAFEMTRSDILVAIGGGVVGDLGGFVAASYLRGIDYVLIPTTTQAQVDSSIGGKVAINLDNTKNIVGSFYQPVLVLIDIATLESLSKRHIMSGLVEALKAGLLRDVTLYNYFKENTFMEHLEDVIYRSLQVKKAIVENDEKENGERKLLNLGHTIGHAIESYYELKDYYHGECVAMGMPYFITNQSLRDEVIAILKNMNTYHMPSFDQAEVFHYILHDKKRTKDSIEVVEVAEVGKPHIVSRSLEDIKSLLQEE